MSEPTTRRLSWRGRQGIAECDDVRAILRACPWPMPIVEIEYAPAVHVAEIRESAQQWRPMTKAERDAADEQLTRCAAAARQHL